MKTHPRPARPSLIAVRYLLSTAALILAAAASRAQSPDATIQQFAKAFNAGDIKAVLALHVSEPSITDEIPPYHWQGPTSAARWLDDLDHGAKTDSITDESVNLGPLCVRSNRPCAPTSSTPPPIFSNAAASL
jgi:hypothetical protein